MTEEELNQIEARASAATNGTWVVVPDMDIDHHETGYARVWSEGGTRTDGRWTSGDTATGVDVLADEYIWIEDATFIAHARQDVPSLIAALRESDAKGQLLDEWYLEQRDRAEAAEATCAALRGQNQRRLDALAFYAEPTNWESPIQSTGWRRAAEALAQPSS